MTLLLRFWPHALAVIAILAAVSWFSHARYEAGYRAAEAVMQARVAEVRRDNERLRSEASNAYAAKDKALTDRVLRIEPGVIRLCQSEPRVREPDATGSADAATAERRHDLQAGEDIGRAALVYGSDCERIRRQLSALQEWASSSH